MDYLIQEYIRLRTQKEVRTDGYYHITITANEEGVITHSIQTSWTGYTETKPKREIREGRLFSHPMDVKNNLEKILKQSCVIVNDEKDLFLFFLYGGHAMIEKHVATIHLANLVNNRECMKDSSHSGFTSVVKNKMQHVPSKKLRMEILSRDDFRCRSCGRSPAVYIDIELHVHHIIPWGIGGITEKENLITICKTCHDGLSPHYYPQLSSLQKDKYLTPIEQSINYDSNVYNYQQKLSQYINDEFEI